MYSLFVFRLCRKLHVMEQVVLSMSTQLKMWRHRPLQSGTDYPCILHKLKAKTQYKSFIQCFFSPSFVHSLIRLNFMHIFSFGIVAFTVPTSNLHSNLRFDHWRRKYDNLICMLYAHFFFSFFFALRIFVNLAFVCLS